MDLNEACRSIGLKVRFRTSDMPTPGYLRGTLLRVEGKFLVVKGFSKSAPVVKVRPADVSLWVKGNAAVLPAPEVEKESPSEAAFIPLPHDKRRWAKSPSSPPELESEIPIKEPDLPPETNNASTPIIKEPAMQTVAIFDKPVTAEPANPPRKRTTRLKFGQQQALYTWMLEHRTACENDSFPELVKQSSADLSFSVTVNNFINMLSETDIERVKKQIAKETPVALARLEFLERNLCLTIELIHDLACELMPTHPKLGQLRQALDHCRLQARRAKNGE